MKNILLPLFFFATVKLLATPAPNFTITSSDNQALNLYQDFINQGKLVVLEAFFIACPPCNTHAPLVQNLYTQMQAAYPGKVEFIMLSTLSGDKNVNVAQYKASKGLTMPAAGSDGGSVTALQPYTSNQFGQFLGTPTFIVIAPGTGEVHFDIRGNSASQTMTLLSEKIAELLPVVPPAPIYCNLRNAFDNDLQAVELQASTISFDTTFTATGTYTLSNIAAFNNSTYDIRPRKTGDDLSGLTTYDLVLISKHILGIQALACDWQRLAADVNCSGSITTMDIVIARKLLLGISQELPCDSWRFVPDSSTATNGDCVEFLGVKIGDITAGPCVQLAPDPEDRGVLELEITDRMLQPGETVFVDITAGTSLTLQGIQAMLSIDPGKLSIQNIYAPQLDGFGPDAFNLSRQQEGIAPIVWINPTGHTISAGSPILSLELMAPQGGRLSEMIGLNADVNLRSEAYDAGGGIQALDFSWRDEALVITSKNKVSFSPNPSHGTFAISMQSDREMPCMVEVLDYQGKVLHREAVQASIGYNNWSINLKSAAPGLYCLLVNGAVAGKLLLQQ